MSVSVLEVTSLHAIPVVPLNGSVTLSTVSGDTIYYGQDQTVSSQNNTGSLTSGGSSVTLTAQGWVRSAGVSALQMVSGVPAQDVVVGADGLGGAGGTALSPTAVQAVAVTAGQLPASVAREVSGRGAPTLYYDATPNAGESPNFSLGGTLANLQAGAYSNQAFGGGFRNGLPSTGNLGQITTGYDNTAIGAGVLVSATTSHSNTAAGADALSALTTGGWNTAIGAQAGKSLTTESNCIAVGQGSMSNAAGGVGPNEAIGFTALLALTTGVRNTAIGYQAASSLTTTNDVVAVGYRAAANIINTGNTAVGSSALLGGTANATNVANSTAIGYNALKNVTTASANTALGYTAGSALTTGASNTLIGAAPGPSLVTGARNTHVGQAAGTTGSNDGNQQTLIGAQTVGSGNYVTALGYQASATANGSMALGVDHNGLGASSAVADQIALGTTIHQVKISNNTTGAGSAALGANCPAVTATAPYTWFKMTSSDGSTVYVPAWK